MTEKSIERGGTNILGLLGILFVGLKLAGVINWSWWWVTAPFWGGLAVFTIIMVVGVVVIAASEIARWLTR